MKDEDKTKEQLIKEITGLRKQIAELESSEIERKEAEKGLRESEERLAQVIRGSSIPTFVIDKNHIITYWNKACEKLLGVPASEMVGTKKQWVPFYPEKRPVMADLVMDEVMEEEVITYYGSKYQKAVLIEDAYEAEGFFPDLCKGGKWLFFTAVPLRDHKGNVTGAMETFQDITRRKRLEKLYSTTAEKSFGGIYIVQDGKFVFINSNAAAYAGYTADEMTGMKSFSIVHPEDTEITKKHSIEMLKKQRTTPYEFRVLVKDGKIRWIMETLVSVDYNGRPAILGNSMDITEQKQAEEELKKSHAEFEQALAELQTTQAQMVQSAKMASVGQLAAGVAHEINNPTGFVSSNLNTLSGYQSDMSRLIVEYRKLIADLKNIKEYNLSISEQVDRIASLEAEADIDFILDDISSLIEESREGTERIKKIVIDLKDFAHPGEDKLKFADINKNLDSTLNVVWNELKYKATVTKDYGDLPEVECYPQQLNQVFMNILVNAAHAIEEKGEIRIATRVDDGHVEIRISDTGTGIPEENLSKLFDPFFTTKDVGSGTGLGLNVAYNIIKKHKGTIDVESEVGRGTTFTIRVPVAG